MGKCIIMTRGSSGDNSDDCTAMKNQVLEGYKAITKDSDDEAESGTMPDLSNKTLARNSSSADIKNVSGYWNTATGYGGDLTIKIPQTGYIENTQIVQAVYGLNPAVVKAGALIGANAATGFDRGTFTSDANAAPSHILSGKTAYVNGNKITGNIASMAGPAIAPSATQQTISCSGKYMTSNVIVNAISLPNASDLREGVNWYGRVGTLKDYSYLAVNHVPFDGASFSGVLAEGAEICSTNPGNTIERNPIEITQYGIRLSTSRTYRVYPTFCPKHSINFAPFRTVRVTCCFSGTQRGAGCFRMNVWDVNSSKFDILTSYRTPLAYKAIGLPYPLAAKYTGDMDVSKVNGEGFLTIDFANDENLEWSKYYISRIEFLT